MLTSSELATLAARDHPNGYSSRYFFNCEFTSHNLMKMEIFLLLIGGEEYPVIGSLILIQYYLFLHLGVAKVIVFVLIVKADVATIYSTVSSIAAVIVTVGAQVLSTLEQFSANRMVIPWYSNKECI